MARSTWGAIAVSVVALSACATSGGTEDNGSGDVSSDDGTTTGDTRGSDTGSTQPDTGTTGGSGTGSDGGSTSSSSSGGPHAVTLATGCPAYGADVYTPFHDAGPVSAGTVVDFPWRGRSGTYPDGIEDFRGYNPLPTEIECGSNKSVRDHLDVTAGCMSAVESDGGQVGEIHGTTDGYFRTFALPYDPAAKRSVAWTDMGVEYRFWYSKWTGNVSNPGFKAFARYMTEYDLYVGSWRMDGVVQIQKKHCGVYTILKRDPGFGPPAPNMWHTIRFEVVGNEQRLYLDGRLAMTTTDDTIKHGTAGIRIDSAEGAHIDDWRVYAP